MHSFNKLSSRPAPPGKVKFVGFRNGGSQFLLQGTPDGATAGVALVQVPISSKVKYSTGNATVTIHGESFKAIYGQIDKTGIAHTVAFLGIEQAAGLVCSTHGMATRQK